MKESEILERITRDKKSGMDDLLRNYGPLIRYVISPILSDAGAREDCYSEVSVRIWEKIEQYNPVRGSLSAWLTAIARNTALNLLRGKSRRESEVPVTEDLPSRELSPEEQVITNERVAELRVLLTRLAPQDRALLYRKYYYRQSIAQIASELGLTERAVDGKLYRLKRRLREQLGDEYHE